MDMLNKFFSVQYAGRGDLFEGMEIWQDGSILDLYRQDIAKYSLDDKVKIKEIFDTIPSELNKKNKRFVLASIKKSARLERYQNSFLWLRDAGAALPCMNVTEPKAPLKLNERHSLFKLFLADTGLLCAAGLDFLLQKGKEILPVEIKSGDSYKNHSALNYVLSVSDWDLKKGYVFCQGNIETEDPIVYYPWYMAMFLKQDTIRPGLVVDVDLSGLIVP